MEEIKIQLKYMMDLIDEDFRFTKSEADGKITYYIFDEQRIPIAELGIYIKDEEIN